MTDRWDDHNARGRSSESDFGVCASRGSLHPQALADLIALKKFSEAQMHSFKKLWGDGLLSSRSREHLLRMIVIEFGFGRVRSIDFYLDVLSPLFPPDEITKEIRQLDLTELILREENDDIVPSQTVVDWYNRIMPIVMEEVAEVVRSR